MIRRAIGHNSQAFLEPDDVEAAPPPDDSALAKVAQLANQQLLIECQITELEEALKAKQADLRAVREGTLPLAMTEVGLTEFRLVGGGKVTVKDFIGASIKEENRDAANDWLEAKGHGDLIKRTITISFDRKDEAWAKKFLRDLSQRKRPLAYSLKRAVNHNTLGAFVREQFKLAKQEGTSPDTKLDRNLLGVFELRYADVKLPTIQWG